MARIVQVANFVSPTSGGIRTCLDELARGYRAAGHERVLVVPGAEPGIDGDRVVLRGRRLPGQPYRVLTDVEAVRRVVRVLRPDAVEVSDRLTLRRLGHDAPSVLLCHERVDAILRPRVPPGFPLRSLADRANRRWSSSFDRIVCASTFVVDEWRRIGVEPRVVPLGVDLATFRPDATPWRREHDVELVLVSRLSTEKRPGDALDALERLRRSGLDARLTVAGDGPLRERLEATAARTGVPVRFAGHLHERGEVAGLLAGSDVAVCPCPHEAFGLAALEAMACGTPVAVPGRGALVELVAGGPHGCGAVDDDLANAVRLALRVCTRDAARRRASMFPWSATVDGLLDAHDLAPVRPRALAG